MSLAISHPTNHSLVLLVNIMAEQSNNSEEQKITFRPKRRAKCLRTKRASSDSDEDKIEEDMRYFILNFLEKHLVLYLMLCE